MSEPSKIPSSRFKMAMRSRSNLMLLVAACLMIALALVWRFGVAPALKVVSSDYEQFYYYEGDLTSDIPGAGDGASTTPVLLERRIISPLGESTSSTSVVREDIWLLNRDTKEQLSEEQAQYSIDRKTGKLDQDGEGGRGGSGYYIVFPFDTPKDDVPVWSGRTGTTHSAKFKKETKLEGLEAYEFELEYENQPLLDAPSGFPLELTGAELKEMLSMPDLPVADGASVKPAYTGGARATLVVEPRMGTVVLRRDVEETTSIEVGRSGEPLHLTRGLSRLTYTQSKQSVQDAVNYAKEEVSKLKLQFVYIPLMCLAIAAASLLAGLFAGTKIKKKRERLVEKAGT